jgi:hypothetical protein
MQYDEAVQFYKEKPHRQDIETACRIEEETRFYTERSLSTDRPPFKREFEKWIKDRLNNDNSEGNFKTALLYPLKTAQFIEDIYTKLSRIWEAQNPYFNITYKKENSDYLGIDELVDLKWWKNKGWQLLKTNHNCILLVNLPQEQEGEKPEPFIDVIKIQDVIGLIMEGGDIKAIMYKYDSNNVGVVDGYSYQIYPIIEKGKSIGQATLDSPNIIGECPAFFLSNKLFNSSNKVVRCNPLTNVLGELKEYLYLHTLKNILDPYVFYLFIIKYGTPGCDYDNGSERCSKGLMTSTAKGVTTRPLKNNYLMNESGTGFKKCPKCNKSLGVGNEITRPIPTDPLDKDLSNVIQFAAPPEAILKYGNDYLKSYGDSLKGSILGNKQEINTAMSHNEVTFRYTIEDQTSVLIGLKSMFDKVIGETTEAKASIIYGSKDAVNEVSIDLGNDFLLLDVQDLYSEKESAGKLGLSTILDFNDRIIETKYRNNPDLKLKAKLINAFRPFDMTLTEVEAGYKAKNISKYDYFKMIYLDQFINWYEINIQSISVLLKTSKKDNPLRDALSKLNIAFDEFFTLKITEEEKGKPAPTEPPIIDPVIDINKTDINTMDNVGTGIKPDNKIE